jgi:hypothetical protein
MYALLIAVHAAMAVWDTWTVVHVTAAKFKPLIFSVGGFASSSVAYIFIIMIMNDFCLSSTQFCYVIIHVRNLESCMLELMCLGNLPVVRRTLFCTRCNFNRCVSATNSQAEVVADLIRALYMVNLILVLNCLLLNRGYILMNVQKALAP